MFRFDPSQLPGAFRHMVAVYRALNRCSGRDAPKVLNNRYGNWQRSGIVQAKVGEKQWIERKKLSSLRH